MCSEGSMLLLPNLPFTQTVRKGFKELGGEITIGKIICEENSLSLSAQRKKGEKTNRQARHEESLPQISDSIRSQL